MCGVFSLSLADSEHGSRLFLAGQENAVVSIVLKAVLENNRARMPLMLWGPTGVGKTYLAEGLAETWKQAEPKRKSVATTGVEFARCYADAIDTDSITSFRQSFQSAGLILVDNVSPLFDKPAATREFCYLLDRWLHQQQIVVCTSSVAPTLLPDASLASRLSSGLSIFIAPPEQPTQRALLENFAHARALELAPPLFDLLVARVEQLSTSSPTPRSLQAAMIQLETTAQLTGSSITLDLIDTLFQTATPPDRVELKQIVNLVARKFGFTLAELRSSSRRQTLVRARGVVALLARELGSESYQAIGVALGNRDHSTIHHSVEKVQKSLETDIPFSLFVENLRSELQPLTVQKPTISLGKPVGNLSATVPHFSASDNVLTRLS